MVVIYNEEIYNKMYGNINQDAIVVAEKCIAQCAGCMCNCRCSCSGGIISVFEWENI